MLEKLNKRWKVEIDPKVIIDGDSVYNSSMINKWGFKVYMRWIIGFRKDCVLMIDDIDLFTTYITTGFATVALEKEDL